LGFLIIVFVIQISTIFAQSSCGTFSSVNTRSGVLLNYRGGLVGYNYQFDVASQALTINSIRFENEPWTRGNIDAKVALIIEQILKSSSTLLNVQYPQNGFSVTLFLPSCWYSETLWENYPNHAEWTQYFRPCTNAGCCKYTFNLKKINDNIEICSKTLLLAGDCKDATTPISNYTTSCASICNAFSLIKTTPTICNEHTSPCRTGICVDGVSTTTQFEYSGGIPYTKDGNTIKIAPKFEIIECPDGTIHLIYLGTSLLSGTWDGLTDKEINEFALDYAIKNLVGDKAQQQINVIIPKLTRSATKISVTNYDATDCCNWSFIKTNLNCCDYTISNISNNTCESRTDIPSLLSLGTGDGSTGNCSETCYWKLDGNGNITENSFIGPTNPNVDFVVKTFNTIQNKMMDRIRIDENHRMDFNLNTWNTSPQITFDAISAVGAPFNGDPTIKLYRSTGAALINGKIPSYNWWLSINGVNGSNGLGAFNILTTEQTPVVGDESTLMQKKFSILRNGNVGIGIEEPAYKLAVGGTGYFEGNVKINGNLKVNGDKIFAKEILIQDPALFWPDVVFKPEYKLLSLVETENYIKANGHLPEVPSAETVKESGISIGEMNSILLKKIEEMTLHLIEIEKKNNELQKKVEVLETLTK
jgi:hypothetical protein